MPLFSRALSAELSRYRKRKRISIDGSVAGMGPSGHARRQYADVPDGWLGAQGAPRPSSIYDAHARYDWPDNDYEAQPSWTDGMPTRTTPPLRLSRPPRPAASLPTYLRMSDELMEHVMQEMQERSAYGEPLGFEDEGHWPSMFEGDDQDFEDDDLPDSELTHRMLGELIQMPADHHPWFGEPDMTQELFEDAMQHFANPMGGVAMDGGPLLLDGGFADEASGEVSSGAPIAGERQPFYAEQMEFGFADEAEQDFERSAAGSVHPWFSADDMSEDGFDQAMAGCAAAMTDGLMADARDGGFYDAAPGDPWQAADPMAQGMFEDAMQQMAGSPMDAEPMMCPAEDGGMMAGPFEQGMAQGLEGIVQEAMPEPMQEPDRMQQMYDEQMMDPWMMPGPFWPGPGFGPMGPMPGP